MKKLFSSLSPLLILFCLIPRLHAESPTMPSDTHATCIANLNAALKNNDADAVKRQAANLKAYGLQGEGERIIQEALKNNKDRKEEIKWGLHDLRALENASRKKDLKECYKLITNLEKKAMAGGVSTVAGAIVGGGPMADFKNAVSDSQGHYSDATVVAGNGKAILNAQVLTKDLVNQIKLIEDGAKKEVLTDGKNLETLETVFNKAADKAKTMEYKPKDTPDGNPKDTPKDTPDETPKDTPENTPTPQTASNSTGGGGETTVFKGYVADGKGKIGLTETTDKNGNVTKVTYTTTDAKGNVTEVRTYGSDGAVAVARETAKSVSQEAAKSAARQRPPIGSGGCTCPDGR